MGLADVVLPNVGFGMEEGRLTAWLKQPGEAVRKGEAIAEVEGDKATVELEALVDGVLDQIMVPADVVVPVGTVLAHIRTGDAESGAVTGPAPVVQHAEGEPEAGAAQAVQPIEETAGSSGFDNARISPVAQRLAQEHGLDLSRITGTGPGGRITREDVQGTIDRITVNGSGKVLTVPAVRKLARDNGIELSTVRATGPEGRVTRADVEAVIHAMSQQRRAAPTPSVTPAAPLTPQPQVAPAPAAVISSGERVEVPLSNMRQVIARRLTKSMQDAPHFYTTAQLDLTDALPKLPNGVGLNAFLLYLVVQALKAVPDVNATYENGHLYHYPNVHLSIAVALPDGLMSPVLRRADDYSLTGLAERTKDLIQRTRAGKLKQDELGGGTFTVSNLGIIEQVERFTAVLNPPQVGILAIGAAKERPVVINHGLHIRTTTYVTLSADHRVVDGLIGAKFLEALDGQLKGFVG